MHICFRLVNHSYNLIHACDLDTAAPECNSNDYLVDTAADNSEMRFNTSKLLFLPTIKLYVGLPVVTNLIGALLAGANCLKSYLPDQQRSRQNVAQIPS